MITYQFWIIYFTGAVALGLLSTITIFNIVMRMNGITFGGQR